MTEMVALHATARWPDAEPGTDFYYAVIRDGSWKVIANCTHRHRTRDAAQRCADREWRRHERYYRGKR